MADEGPHSPLLASYGLAQQGAPGSQNCPVPWTCSDVPGSLAWGCRGMLEVALAISITLHPRETLDSDSSAAGGGWMQRELQRSIV